MSQKRGLPEPSTTFESTKRPRTNAGPQNSPASNILMCNILNPIYSITVHEIYTVMAPYGSVLRIVLFFKHGLQCLVEFMTASFATNAFSALNGQDMYTGCCKLKIEFSKAQKLNVYANDDISRDFTNPHLPAGPYKVYRQYQPPTPSNWQQPQPPRALPEVKPQAPVPAQSSVLIVYGIAMRLMNVDYLFNLFSVYGDVRKIKTVTQKKELALVHMETVEMASRARDFLHGVTVFGQQLHIHFSKSHYIGEPADGATTGANLSSKDFSSLILNRFSKNPSALKRILLGYPLFSALSHSYLLLNADISRPSATLYFANAPGEFSTLQDFAQLFAALNAPAPLDAIFFAPLPAHAARPTASRAGLLAWPDLASAVAALVLANNYKIGHQVLRLSFTANSINRKPAQVDPHSSQV